MTLRQASDRRQDRGHLALPGVSACPDPQAGIRQARFYRRGSLSGWVAVMQQGNIVPGLRR